MLSEGPRSPWTQLAQPLRPACQDAVPSLSLPHPTARAFACQPVAHPRSRAAVVVLPLQPLGTPRGWVPGWWARQPLPEQQAFRHPICPLWGLDTHAYPSIPSQHLRQASSWSHLSPHAAHWTLPPKRWASLMPGGPLSMEHPQGLEEHLPRTMCRPCQNTGPSSGHASLCQASHAQELMRPARKPVQEAEEKMWLPGCRKEHPQPQPQAGPTPAR